MSRLVESQANLQIADVDDIPLDYGTFLQEHLGHLLSVKLIFTYSEEPRIFD